MSEVDQILGDAVQARMQSLILDAVDIEPG